MTTNDQKTGLLGLVTNAGRLAAPAGSLEVANNVVVRKRGVVEPRPGLTSFGGAGAALATPYKVWEYDGVVHYWGADGFVYNEQSATPRSYTNVNGNTGEALSLFRADLLSTLETRDNCYIGTRTGVFKLTSSTDTVAGECGAPSHVSIACVLSSSGSPTALATGYQVAYRCVVVRTENGLTTRSLPSGAVSISNASGATRNVILSNTQATGFAGAMALGSSDVLEIYRTRAFTTASTIDEEYALIGTMRASVFETFVDTLTDAQRGAALYTGPSQGGATQENQRPPAAGCMELYKGHVFFGNTVGPFRTVVSANISTADLGGSATGIGYRAIASCNTAVGSPLVTSMANTTGLEAGMILAFPSTGFTFSFPANTYIVSVDSATQVTMSANATALNVNVTCVFVDAVKIGGEWKPVFGSMNSQVFQYMTPFVAGVSAMLEPSWYGTIDPLTELMSTSSKTYYARTITPPAPRYTHTFVFEELARSSQSAATATIQATHGSEYSTNLASAVNMTRDVFKNGIVWSKRDEPEHVSSLNYALVGSSKAHVLGLCATRDALLIIKEDGIWRLTGPGGNNATTAWRIDALDLNTACVLPQSIQRMNGKCYFLSNRGVVRVDSAVEVVSAPINDEAKRLAAEATAFNKAQGYYMLRTLQDPAWASAVNAETSEYMLSIGEPAVEDVTASSLRNLLVFNEDTSAWATWSFPTAGGFSCGDAYPLAMAWCPKAVGGLVLAVSSSAHGTSFLRKLYSLNTESSVLASYDARDDGYLAVTVTTVTGSTAAWTVTYTPAKLLRVGDVIARGATAYRVTSVTSSTIVVVQQLVNNASEYDTFTTGAAVVAASVEATVRTRPFTAPSHAQKLWSYITASLAVVDGPTGLVLTSMSSSSREFSDDDATVSEACTLPYYAGVAAAYRGNDLKMNVPRTHARARDLWAGVRITCALGSWELDSFYAGAMEGLPGKLPYVQSGAP